MSEIFIIMYLYRRKLDNNIKLQANLNIDKFLLAAALAARECGVAFLLNKRL